jgi:hypothetical protein
MLVHFHSPFVRSPRVFSAQSVPLITLGPIHRHLSLLEAERINHEAVERLVARGYTKKFAAVEAKQSANRVCDFTKKVSDVSLSFLRIEVLCCILASCSVSSVYQRTDFGHAPF